MSPHRESIHLSVAPEDIFDQLVDLGRSLETDHDVDEVERTDRREGEGDPDAGAPRTGTRWRATNRVDGRPEHVDIELTEVERPRRFTLSVTSAGLRTHETIELRPDGDGCEVVSTVSFLEGGPEQEGPDDDRDEDEEQADRPAFVALGALAARGLQDPSPGAG